MVQWLIGLVTLTEDLFGSQSPHAGSQLSGTPILWHLMLSSDLCSCQGWHYIHALTKYVHRENK